MLVELGLRAHNEVTQQLLPVLREIGESARELFLSLAKQKSVSGKPTKSFVGYSLCSFMVLEVAPLVHDIAAAVVATSKGQPAKTDNENEIPATTKYRSSYSSSGRCAPMCFFNSQTLFTIYLPHLAIGQSTYSS